MAQQEIFFQKPIKFIQGAMRAEQFPQRSMPEIAFWGRSNVGKSSLINKLIFKKDLARTSKTPGRTQQINFFDLNNQLLIADLPGYGFANVPEKVRRQWEELFLSYLEQRDQLRMVFLLIDSRRGIMDIDQDIMHLLADTSNPFTVLLTKTDTLKKNQVQAKLSEAQELIKTFPAMPEVIETSAKKSTGIKQLRQQILLYLKK